MVGVGLKATSLSECKSVCNYGAVKSAIAKAAACSFVSILALARDACTPGTSYACSSTYTLSNTDKTWVTKCPTSDVCVPSIKAVCKSGNQCVQVRGPPGWLFPVVLVPPCFDLRSAFAQLLCCGSAFSTPDATLCCF